MKVKLTGQGQINIPLQVQHKLGWQVGDELSMTVEGAEIKLKAIKTRKIIEFYGILPATQAYPGKEKIREVVANSLAKVIF